MYNIETEFEWLRTLYPTQPSLKSFMVRVADRLTYLESTIADLTEIIADLSRAAENGADEHVESLGDILRKAQIDLAFDICPKHGNKYPSERECPLCVEGG